ncbi:NACHT, LRR and PYD domains-containing protein 3-like [Erpetoichthys calabaricus]|uniref:NACHT, LRR and PYD domains-containing protein 3-like n=1 Tax=Erpetoichthys calabaricus TaxID=27687 RepID=UPI002234950C|nr:NACHT, LRR and PYD domains-containing protein 3-like [Erpetoichthys calabaricus]
MENDKKMLVSLWVALAEEVMRFPSPNLTRILEEVTKGAWSRTVNKSANLLSQSCNGVLSLSPGSDVSKEIQASLKPPHIRIHIKGLYETHKRDVCESTKKLEDQPSPGNPRTQGVGFDTRYTELMVIKQYKRSYNETHHELVKTGTTHAEMMEEHTKVKCERIWTEQLLRRSPGSETCPNIVVVSGVAGIGKTTMVQKIMYDWARGTQNQRFAFVFLFKFRELNLLDTETEPQQPLTRLIARHYKYLYDDRLKEILQKPESLLFILDGLDEYKHKLDFTQKKLCSNPEELFSVHVLITSLVSQTLLKGCSVLITSRPTALESLDMKRVNRFAEILGFFPEQRLMYFKNFFGDADLGTEAFRYVEENAILYTMCFNPSYCWIICSVLKSHFMTPAEERGASPKTVTELFVMFLHNILTNHRREAEDQKEILVKLGKMAYYGVTNRTLVFYDKFEMSTFGLQSILSTTFLSGFLKEILQRESTLQHTTYTFFHLTLQEFMAACSFYLEPSGGIEGMLMNMDYYKDGRFEIFTRFLAGLASPSVFETVGLILGKFDRTTAKLILDWLKKKAEQAAQSRNKLEVMQVCQWLYETQNKKLIRDAIGKDLNMDFSNTTLSPLDCAVLGSIISCCGKLLGLNLSNTNLTPECIRRVSQGLVYCRSVGLVKSGLTCECCMALSSALSAEHSQLNELWLNNNALGDYGVRLLCEGLRNKNCKLEKLSLRSCHLTSTSCAAFSSALSNEHSRLTELELLGNKLEDLGAHRLCEGLRSPNCKLQKLTFNHLKASHHLVSVTQECRELRMSPGQNENLGLFPSHSLSYSPCLLFFSPHHYRLSSCGLTSGCCQAFSSVLSADCTHLNELWLGENNLEDLGVCMLCQGLRNQNCKLEKLRLDSCGLTSGCCSELSLVFSTEHSRLTELELRHNNLEDSGVHQLCEGLRSNNCKIKKLGLQAIKISEDGSRSLESLKEDMMRSGWLMDITI